jgi:AAA domain-containing protein
MFVLGGPPGVGKSRAGVALAVAGATCKPWFGMKTHTRFKTMIIQNENGRLRLSREFSGLNCDCATLDPWIRICPPPPFGLAFDRNEFIEAVVSAIAKFKPHVVLLDPWNAVARDEKAKEYLETFEKIRAVIPAGDSGPALGIIAHTRKPRGEEKATGRGLLNLLAGSYVLGSMPRSVCVMQPASDDPEDDRVVCTWCKNNDGESGKRSAWHRRNGLFLPVSDFDFDAFDHEGEREREKITLADLESVFEGGKRPLAPKSQIIRELKEKTGAGRSTCYSALRANGPFAGHLCEEGSLVRLLTK